MHVLITAGPTRQPIDSVRFITNASSGRMGFAVAGEALRAGHEVTLLVGPVSIDPPAGAEVRRFVTVADLKALLADAFPLCDALVMTAAVGDFQIESPLAGKLSRRDGAVDIHLVPTEDLLAGVAAGKRADQKIIAFAVEDGPDDAIEAKARRELQAKHADMVVLNTPAAMAAADSRACILSADAALLPWAMRSKAQLAREIVTLLAST